MRVDRQRGHLGAALLLGLLPSVGSSTRTAPKPALRASAKLSYQRVSELEARIYSRQLLKYGNLGLNGESDVQAASAVTGALVVGGAASGAIVLQELPGPDIVRWCVSALLICSPYYFLGLGLTSPGLVEKGISAAKRLVSPAYRARMLRHEAGHFLAGYLVGLPVVSYTANAAASAVECGPPVGAPRGDGAEAVADVSAEDALNRLAVVSLAGIVAECLCFGQAEGGLADLSQLNTAQARSRSVGDGEERDNDERNRVRWAAVQAYALLHGNGAAFERLVRAMDASATVAQCEAALEGHGHGEPGGASAGPWAFAAEGWPVERKAKEASRPKAAPDAEEPVGARALVQRALGVATRDPYLSATVVAMLGAVALVLEAVGKGTPLH